MSVCLSLCSTLLDFIENKDPFVWHGYMLACAMFTSSIVGVLCMHHHFNISYTTGLRVRTALTSAIYRKVRLCSEAYQKAFHNRYPTKVPLESQGRCRLGRELEGRLFYLSPCWAFHPHRKSHLFKNSYPDTPDRLPSNSPPKRHPP